ncbi:MAG TPA: exopolysaccharide biosynthesis protein, partial [Ruminococcus sp.]|nr:exopolysaccharide biosynthesis protein [Ruminococcus sp.]
STISYKRRMAMEIYYIKNRSVGLDIKIFFKTIISVFKGEGAK